MANASTPDPENLDYDLVVVGNGFGGATAALSFLTAAKHDGKTARAALIEAGPREAWTGASQWAKPMLRLTRDEGLAADRDERSDPDQLDPVARDYWRAFEEGVPETAAFMAEHKAWLGHRDEPDAALDFEGGHYGYLMGGGKGVLDSFLTRITADADVLFEHETVELVRDDDAGGVTGVVVSGPDGTHRTLVAGAVVLASGGFAGDPERLRSSLGDAAADVPTLARGLRFNRGTGLQMAIDVGAATVGRFDAVHAQLVDTRSDRDQALLSGQNYGIVVNADAERFVDEGGDYVFAVTEAVADATWRHQQGRSWFVTDATVTERFAGSWMYETTDLYPERADTVAGLAEALGLDPTRLEATVEQFNAACAADGPQDWDPSRLDGNTTSGLTPPKSNWAIPLVSPPFAGFPMTAHISSTFGGLRVDAHSHVLDTEYEAIPGLYAVGEITGHVHDRHLAATSVLRAMNFGRIVGQDVAASLPEPETGASGESSSAGTAPAPDAPPTQAWAGTTPYRG